MFICWQICLQAIDVDYNDLTNALGLDRNDSKDVSGTTVECLGVEIDTMEMTARLSETKLNKAARLVSEALTANRLTQLQAQELVGFLSFCSTVVRLGRTYLRRIWDSTASFTRSQSLRPLTDGAIADLTWWRDLLPHFNGIQLLLDTSRTTYHLFTDASSKGMGAFWYQGSPAQSDWRIFSQVIPQSNAFAYEFKPHEKDLHINITEVLVIQLAF